MLLLRQNCLLILQVLLLDCVLLVRKGVILREIRLELEVVLNGVAAQTLYFELVSPLVLMQL